ncbi:MAG: dTDP-4-dehydrorhamnose 3,5-epimerase [Planctomycetes bacterium]|nr:dTDP-4-dehydrorhamnose 3,5-epimerase [Planctomycetota bacterium]
MRRIATGLADLAVLEADVFVDERGWFMEAANRRTLADLGIVADFVQDNQSLSHRDVLRGLHYQIGRPQAKLVRCLGGAVFDVAVDLRRNGPHFGRWYGTELSAANRRSLWIPAGFAHGFLTLSPTAEVLYKVDAYWDRSAERGLRWDDPDVAIDWPLAGRSPCVCDRDRALPALARIPLQDLPICTATPRASA